jgi:hypothetical protein
LVYVGRCGGEGQGEYEGVEGGQGGGAVWGGAVRCGRWCTRDTYIQGNIAQLLELEWRQADPDASKKQNPLARRTLLVANTVS